MKYNDYTVADLVMDDLFVKWVKHGDAESEFFWRNWLAKNPGQYEKIQKAKDIVQSFEYKQNYEPAQDDFIEVLENIHKQPESDIKPPTIKKLFTPFTKVAASITVLVASIWLAYSYLDLSTHNKAEDLVAKQPEYIVKATSKGQKLSLKLPDGSSVKLNADSELKVATDFNQMKERVVYLKGEAFFEVVKDKARPFKIYSGGLETTVLGTSFNIRAYPDEKNEKVAVLTGKVAVNVMNDENVMDSSLLYPNCILSYSHEREEKLLERNVNITSEIAWLKGILVYEHVSLKKILNDLERWYDVTFEIEKGVNMSLHYSGTFDNQSLDNVLQGLSFTTNGFTYTIEDKKVKITQ